MQPGGPGGGVTPCPKAHKPPCLRPTPGGVSRSDRKELHSRGCWWVTSPMFTPGKDSCTRQTATRAVLLAGRIVGYTMTGTHANRIDPKRSAKIGGSELPAHQGCDDFSCRVRGSQYTSAEYTATMNKYGFLASVGRTGVCHVQCRSRYHSTPPAQERTRQPGGSTTPEEKQSKR